MLKTKKHKTNLKPHKLCCSGVKAEEIRKGRIWAVLKEIWKVFLEILPLQKSNEKRRQTSEKSKEKHKKNK